MYLVEIYLHEYDKSTCMVHLLLSYLSFSDQCIDRSKCDSVDVVVDTSVYPHKTKEEIV